MYSAILIKEIEYFDGLKMVKVKENTEIKVDLENSFAQVNGMCFTIQKNEFLLLN